MWTNKERSTEVVIEILLWWCLEAAPPGYTVAKYGKAVFVPKNTQNPEWEGKNSEEFSRRICLAHLDFVLC